MEKNRIEAFSDGVIAIIITLLVLELKVPHIEGEINTKIILSELARLSPKFLSWAVSFFMILIMWVNHHRIFTELKSSDNGLLWINGFLLFSMSFVPFPTALMGDYFSQPLAMSFFGIFLTLVGLSFFLLRLYLYKNPELYKETADMEKKRKLLKRTLISPVLYSLGALFAFVNVYAAYTVYFIIPLYFIFFGTEKKKGIES
jgi:uncharacterized membrane protein